MKAMRMVTRATLAKLQPQPKSVGKLTDLVLYKQIVMYT